MRFCSHSKASKDVLLSSLLTSHVFHTKQFMVCFISVFYLFCCIFTRFLCFKQCISLHCIYNLNASSVLHCICRINVIEGILLMFLTASTLIVGVWPSYVLQNLFAIVVTRNVCCCLCRFVTFSYILHVVRLAVIKNL
jgi:hypothetical protein